MTHDNTPLESAQSKRDLESRPTIVLVAHEIREHGGMDRVLSELIRRGHTRYRFVVLARYLSPELRMIATWVRVPVPLRPFPLKFVAFFLLAGLRLRRLRGDIVHVTGAIVPNRADLASIHHCHAAVIASIGAFAPPDTPRLRRLNTSISTLLALFGERWCYRPSRVRMLAAATLRVVAEVKHYYPGIPIVITPNGVDTDRFRPSKDVRREVRLSEGVMSDEIIALFLGGDWNRKGLKIAVEAIGHAGQMGINVSLWVVGKGDEKYMAGFARRLGAPVRFFGTPVDTLRFYQAADIFVLPSLYETFSLPAHEAAACGLPIISTRVGGVEELIGDGDAGLLVKREPTAFATAIEQLSDRDLRLRLGREARRRASTRTWSRSVESVLAVYDELLGGESRPSEATVA